MDADAKRVHDAHQALDQRLTKVCHVQIVVA